MSPLSLSVNSLWCIALPGRALGSFRRTWNIHTYWNAAHIYVHARTFFDATKRYPASLAMFRAKKQKPYCHLGFIRRSVELLAATTTNTTTAVHLFSNERVTFVALPRFDAEYSSLSIKIVPGREHRCGLSYVSASLYHVPAYGCVCVPLYLCVKRQWDHLKILSLLGPLQPR